MRIFNKQAHTCFFPYAGSSRRGVNLKSGEQSPDLPPDRVNHPSLQSDLRRGRIGVILAPTDKAAIRGTVSEEILAMLEGAKAPTKPEQPKEPLGKQMDPRPPQQNDKPEEKPDSTYEVEAKDEVVDPVKEELKAKTDMMTEEGKKEELDKLADSDQPSVAKAAEELKNEEPADDKGTDTTDTAGDDEETGADAPAAGGDADGDEAGSGSEDAAEPSGDAGSEETGSVVEDGAGDVAPEPDSDPEPAKPSKPKQYKGIAKAKLISMLAEREIECDPSLGIKKMRKLLVDDDKKKAEG